MTEIWGRTDYVAVAGIHNGILLALGFSQAYINQVGDGTDSGVIHDQSRPDRPARQHSSPSRSPASPTAARTRR